MTIRNLCKKRIGQSEAPVRRFTLSTPFFGLLEQQPSRKPQTRPNLADNSCRQCELVSHVSILAFVLCAASRWSIRGDWSLFRIEELEPNQSDRPLSTLEVSGGQRAGVKFSHGSAATPTIYYRSFRGKRKSRLGWGRLSSARIEINGSASNEAARIRRPCR
jgi:hypothetical protein